MSFFLLDNSGNIITNGSSLFAMTASATPEPNGSGALFLPFDWWLSDRQAGGTLRVGIINLPAGATDVEYKLGNGSWTSGGSTTAFNITGLTNDTAYLVYIRPVFSGGPGSHLLPKKGVPTAAPSSTIYASPTGSGDGSYANPYSLSGALSAATSGTRIVLKDGTYSQNISITSGTYSPAITITAENVHAARLNGGIGISNATSGVHFKDIFVSPDNIAAVGTLFRTARMDGTCTNCMFENLKIHGIHDVAGYLSWSSTDWNNTIEDLIRIASSGTNTIRNCIGRYGRLGINTGLASNLTSECNSVSDIGNDGFKIGNSCTYTNDFVANLFVQGGAHPDMMQSDDPGKTNVTIDGFVGIEWMYGDITLGTGVTYGTQGICGFNGTNENWLVQNCVIYLGYSVHGISVYNGVDVTIRNNTLISSEVVTESQRPTVNVASASSNVQVRNNIVASAVVGVTAPVTTSDNSTLAFADNATNYPGLADWDFRLASGNGNLTNGDAANDPATDIRGVTRSATTPARGAFEDAYS